MELTLGDLIVYLNHYGYVVLFVALMLELIALPLPGEVLMSYCGFLIFNGELNLFLSILIAWIGTSMGVTISYIVGSKLGWPFLEKYGKIFHLKPKLLVKTSKWFSKYGDKLLIIAYFIPGVRHVTGYFSGITRLPYRTFALYAYIGSLLWVTVFVYMGRILGKHWELLQTMMTKYLIIGCIVAIAIIAILLICKKFKVQIKNTIYKILHQL
ncbi:DedA family protein [Rummeliibacillus sp. JY-2-4R]